MPAIKFTVYGTPVAQGRGRATMVNGKVVVYDPARSRDYKQYVRTEALKVRPVRPLDGPVSLTVQVYLGIPKSFSARKRLAAINGEVRPTTKPDLKNLIAGVEDSLKGIVWQDDSQVVNFGRSGKWYSDTPRVEVEVVQI